MKIETSNTTSDSSMKLIACYEWVLLSQILSIVSLEIKGARVLLDISMNPTESFPTAALEPHQTNFLVAAFTSIFHHS
jgi:hypothetical protein